MQSNFLFNGFKLGHLNMLSMCVLVLKFRPTKEKLIFVYRFKAENNLHIYSSKREYFNSLFIKLVLKRLNLQNWKNVFRQIIYRTVFGAC